MFALLMFDSNQKQVLDQIQLEILDKENYQTKKMSIGILTEKFLFILII